ncbi:MAG: ribosomal RNA small subunit methyltransferase A [Verrucomicrobia bacterium]|nr:ribosomal RNA small subunit methyltransferase A [Verrucomicrobiota bacterium]
MPLSPSATRELLARLGHQPKRFLGQNFLVDGNIVRKSLELAQVGAEDVVIEVGPGLGTLTGALLEAGAEVWAVEKDRHLHHHLEESLVPSAGGRLHLLEGDAVESPLAGFPGNRPFKIVANLPYAVSTPWMDAVLSGPLPDRMVLMLQQEAAQRYAARPGGKDFGAISIFLQSAYEIAPGHRVDAACFYPKPEVESYLLHLVRRGTPHVFASAAKTVIRACFQQRRKQLGGLLRGLLPDGGAAWLAELTRAGFTAQARAETIPVELWQRLAVSGR